MSSKKKWDFLKFLILIAIILGFFYLIILYFHGFPAAENTSKSKADQKILVDKKSENEVVFSDFTKEDLDKLSKIRIKAQQFKDIDSTYINIEDAPIDAETKKILYERALNLSQFGSFSKGKQTHEFENQAYYADRLKELGGEKNLLNQLSFTPTNLQEAIGSEYNLVGGDFSGVYIEGQGYDSIFRSYQNGDKLLEINEYKVSPDNSQVYFFKENINSYVNSSPSTNERIENGIYNISWISKNRLYSMSSKGMTEGEALSIAQKIDSLTK